MYAFTDADIIIVLKFSTGLISRCLWRSSLFLDLQK